MSEYWHGLKIAESINWVVIGSTLLRIVLIACIAGLAARGLQRLVRAFRERITSHLHDPEQIKRAETLSRAFRYLSTVLISLIAGTLILAEVGVSVAPIVGAAGVVGLAVAFGAQSLIKDYFNGFFILLENQIRQGDVVDAGGKSGFVEEITLRYIRLRDYDGNVHFVPNGLVTTVSNMSRGFAQAVVDVSVSYREDVDEVMASIARIASTMRTDATFGDKILNDLEMAGVDRLGDSAVVIRCRFEVKPLEQWNVKREFLRRLKNTFDKEGIEIPYPHLTLYPGALKDGSAPAFHMVTSAERAPSATPTSPT